MVFSINNAIYTKRKGGNQGHHDYIGCLKRYITRAFSIKLQTKKVHPIAEIRIGDYMQTERGIGEVRSVSTYYSPFLMDIFYGNDKVGYCFLTDTKRRGWGRSIAEECKVISLYEKNADAKRA